MEQQLTMFDEVKHPLLKGLKCTICGGKDLEITTDGKVLKSNGVESISGCYSCKECLYGEAFAVNSIKKEA